MIDFVKTYITYVLFKKPIPKEGFDLANKHWKNKPKKGCKLWLYNKIKKINIK